MVSRGTLGVIINPWRACAARVTVLGLSFHPFVCLSVCLSGTTFKNGDFCKSTAFKSYYLNQILPILSTVEAVEVTQRASMWSWFAKNSTY